MGTLFCRGAEDARAAAEAYVAACDARFSQMAGEAGGVWAHPRQDRDGGWVAPLFGPPWPTTETAVAEPEDCAALRAGAVVIAHPAWPQEDDA